ncbi:NCS2 family permease [Cohnella rhizosphaerae]|uniref:NCS2 family permease n=1 Tax=Cohnella rhizosphaerae TaxID=1457232 RepID=A0A9X4QSK4_9BACL|nr:NCS2 family permease [Cohnella rhizosphaerae]MDG0810176.1 NCS2 family permease [Cohnella rhizosphaerae]
MERFFKLKEFGTNVRTEIMAGITTFMTMAYILAVNPLVLGNGTGLDMYGIFLATALGAGIFTLAMGLFVNFPVALAPGMGLNAYFATTVVASEASGHAISASMALAAVFISGIIFIILTVTKVRQMLIVAIPDSIKVAITVGIGLFITIIGLKGSGLLTISLSPFADYAAGSFNNLNSNETIFHLGDITEPSVWLTVLGLLVISALMVLRVRGAILIGILITTLVGAIPGVDVVTFDSLKSADWVPNFSKLNFWDFDFADLLTTGLLSAIATFTFVELFDTFGTMVGTANRAGFFKDKEKGRKLVGKAMLVDAVAVSGGAVLGTSTMTAYVESAAGIAEGGRTGLTSSTTGVLFLLSLFLAPIALLVPSPATSAALIIVGVLMMQSVKEIDFEDLVLGIPAFLTIAMMPFTYNIANGISFGIISYVVLAVIANLAGKKKYQVHWLMWVLFVLVIARYVFIGAEG